MNYYLGEIEELAKSVKNQRISPVHLAVKILLLKARLAKEAKSLALYRALR